MPGSFVCFTISVHLTFDLPYAGAGPGFCKWGVKILQVGAVGALDEEGVWSQLGVHTLDPPLKCEGIMCCF